MEFETLHALKSINIAGMYDQNVKLKSTDEEFFDVPGHVASKSKLLKARMKEVKERGELQSMFVNVRVHSRFLNMVIEFCTYHADCKMQARRSLPVSEKSIDAWNAELIANLNFDELMALHEAAHHMKVKKLHVLTGRKLTKLIINTIFMWEEKSTRHRASLNTPTFRRS